MLRTMRASPVIFLLIALLALTSPAHAQQQTTPHVAYVFPAGGRQGGTFQSTIGGQRLETGLDPVTHAEQLEVTQNDPAASPPDRRYVAASVCVRPLTAAERLAQFHEGVQP